MKKHIKKIVLVSSVFMAFACNTEINETRRTKSDGSIIDQNGMDAAAAQLNLTSIKLKNCDQLLRTMSKVTGVSFKAEKVDGAYGELKGACPSADDLESLSPSNISMAVKLSMEFCGGFVKRIKDEKLVPSIDFSKNAKEALSETARADLYKFFYNQLWYGDVRKDVPPLEDLVKQSNALLEALVKEDGVAGKENATQNIIQGLCTPILSAAPITTL